MVNPRTDFWKDQQVVRRRFQGLSRDEAAAGLMSTGGASRAMDAFVEFAESDIARALDTVRCGWMATICLAVSLVPDFP